MQSEFARQAESFAASKTLASGELTAAITGALGEAAGGRILDLAAGPGLMASALAGKAREVVALDLTAETLIALVRALAAMPGGDYHHWRMRRNGRTTSNGSRCDTSCG